MGCSSRINAIFLARNGWQVTAVDFSGAAIIATARRAARAVGGATFLEGDVTSFPQLPIDKADRPGARRALLSSRCPRAPRCPTCASWPR